jgi:hypothetical protein
LSGLVYQRGDGLDTANKEIWESFFLVADASTGGRADVEHGTSI